MVTPIDAIDLTQNYPQDFWDNHEFYLSPQGVIEKKEIISSQTSPLENQKSIGHLLVTFFIGTPSYAEKRKALKGVIARINEQCQKILNGYRNKLEEGNIELSEEDIRLLNTVEYNILCFNDKILAFNRQNSPSKAFSFLPSYEETISIGDILDLQLAFERQARLKKIREIKEARQAFYKAAKEELPAFLSTALSLENKKSLMGIFSTSKSNKKSELQQKFSKLHSTVNFIGQYYKDKRFVEVWKRAFRIHRSLSTPKEMIFKIKPLFVANLLTKESYDKVAKQLDIWLRMSETEHRKMENISAKDDTAYKQIDILESHIHITNCIKAYALQRFHPKSVDSPHFNGTLLTGAFDDQGRLQSIAIIIPKYGYSTKRSVVKFLSTAPWNFRFGSYTEDPRRVEGAATSLIEHTIYQGWKASAPGDVYVDAIPNSEEFYRKIGFITPRISLSGEIGTECLALTKDKILHFLRDFGGRAFPVREQDLKEPHEDLPTKLKPRRLVF